MKTVSFQELVKEVLNNAVNKKGTDANCIVAIAPDLPGCITQGDNHEEACENLLLSCGLHPAYATGKRCQQ